MIIDKTISIKIAKYNIEHYKEYFDVRLGDIIDIDVELHLQKNSNKKINVECDICKVRRYIKYQAYNKNINSNENYRIYTCDKCSHIKIKDYNKSKYGVEYYSQHPDRNDKVKNTCISKYGVEHFSKSNEFKEKISKTNLDKFGYINPFMDTNRIKGIFKDKYGVYHPSQVKKFKDRIEVTNLQKYGYSSVLSSPSIRNKIEVTNMEKYGGHPMKNNYILDKMKNSNLEKYGYEFILSIPEKRNEISITNLEKYGVENPMMSEEIRKGFIISNDINYIKYIGSSYSLFYCKSGHEFTIHIDNYHSRLNNNIKLCTVCNPISDSKSLKENELSDFISSIYNKDLVLSYRDKLEIDIYLPDLKLGFEFNGLYWHSNKYKDKNYHINKTNYFKDKGIRIIHIWEDDWLLKREIVESQIKNLLNINTERIYARKCIVRGINSKESGVFLDNNHIQGRNSSSLKLGLYYNNELVSIMTFDHFEGRKKMEDGGWNLSRFCNKINTNVVGGASKLLSYFISNNNVSRIVSYADKDWSVGELYYTLGFENIGESLPDYKYIINNKRVNKSRYRKSKLNTTLTESKAMEGLGIDKIYDCGKIKFEYKS